MAEYTILCNGYASKKHSDWNMNPTVVYIKDKSVEIIADPGNNIELLKRALKENNINPDKIGFVFITHFHRDNFLCANFFKNAYICDGYYIFKDSEFADCEDYIPQTDIHIVKTPGHTKEHASLVFETEKGIIAVAGDVFWWKDSREDFIADKHSLMSLDDEFAVDRVNLFKSRMNLLGMAEFIIPGHGTCSQF